MIKDHIDIPVLSSLQANFHLTYHPGRECYVSAGREFDEDRWCPRGGSCRSGPGSSSEPSTSSLAPRQSSSTRGGHRGDSCPSRISRTTAHSTPSGHNTGYAAASRTGGHRTEVDHPSVESRCQGWCMWSGNHHFYTTHS